MGDWVILFPNNLFSRPNVLWSTMIFAILGVHKRLLTRIKICFTLGLSNYNCLNH